MRKRILAASVIFASVSQALCQANVNTDMNVTSQATVDSDVLRVRNTYTGTAQDRIGIRSTSIQTGGWGIGAELNGGWCGLYCYATASGGNSGRQGGYFNATGGGTGNHFGVQGLAHDVAGPKYGVKGGAWGGAGVNYGVYGAASGSTSNYGVYCYGNGGYTGSWGKASDEKLKKNITPLENALSRLSKVKAIYFEFDLEKYPDMGLNKGKEYGVTAQNIETVFPELVRTDYCPVEKFSKLGNADSVKNMPPQFIEYKSVDYTGLIPILIKAIQEQQEEIEHLKWRAGIK